MHLLCTIAILHWYLYVRSAWVMRIQCFVVFCSSPTQPATMASIEATDARMDAMQALVQSADEAARPEVSKTQVAAFLESLAKLNDSGVNVSEASRR